MVTTDQVYAVGELCVGIRRAIFNIANRIESLNERFLASRIQKFGIEDMQGGRRINAQKPVSNPWKPRQHLKGLICFHFSVNLLLASVVGTCVVEGFLQKAALQQFQDLNGSVTFYPKKTTDDATRPLDSVYGLVISHINHSDAVTTHNTEHTPTHRQ